MGLEVCRGDGKEGREWDGIGGEGGRRGGKEGGGRGEREGIGGVGGGGVKRGERNEGDEKEGEDEKRLTTEILESIGRIHERIETGMRIEKNESIMTSAERR